MTESVDWLPKLIEFNTYGNWETFLEAIYAQFRKDFEESRPRWPGKRVSYKRHPETQGKSATFWHFVSEGSKESERLPDLRRGERIAWPRAIMDRFTGKKPEPDHVIFWWENKRGNEKRILLALPDFSYVVILADRGEYIMPWTAYPVERSHQRDKLKKEFVQFWKGAPS